jgi:hypothetical protein
LHHIIEIDLNKPAQNLKERENEMQKILTLSAGDPLNLSPKIPMNDVTKILPASSSLFDG